MKLIDGVGGAFIFSEDPKRLADWYAAMLGFEFEGDEEFGAFYQVFFAVDREDSFRKLDTTFAIMRARESMDKKIPDEEPDSMYGDQPFMVNLRVRDLEALLAQLERSGVRALKRENEPYGKFAWIRDLDGNRLELYEPIAT